ncbi:MULTISPECIES: DUF2651 family protein [Bacillus]|jgi:hypothetical protein|uniref:DUF2651 domain-containing protein n=1 Tax=Bacillus pumilus (strain SAFR-032) TaxID=315750 RepID=A8FDU3_BACP2|nr:DUF2651 family protein [Bacillus pumilus]ABV62410.1 hypothetical protein BPUM_1738 [Bacillus pumilus SAFR-032]MBC3643032.1 DUF2651 family protein [Bacillus pumilus]MBC3645147.1 DUF2651 family protein [Bacillus pumilus]MBC3649004.1 DUF2651 family protein [Bacillus pumilus]MBC3654390.1 DUF2651 family protein [Bacillus pumilus]
MMMSFLQPMALILFTLPLLILIWGIVGYILFKRVYIVLMITFAASTIFIFAYTGFDMSNMYWVITMTFLCMCTSVITKIIHYMIRRYKKG